MHSVIDTFGFHSAKSVAVAENEYSALQSPYRMKSKKGDAICLNFLNIAGYIPLIGLIPLIARTIHPICNKNSGMENNSKLVQIAYMIRGVIEGLGLGLLYLIPDIAITLYRFCISNSLNKPTIHLTPMEPEEYQSW